MLSSIRKFSTSIFAKILLLIIIIPFVFWGMGSSLTGGNKNVVVVINKDKHTIQEFSDFINRTAKIKVKPNDIESFLQAFIGEKLIEKEVEFTEIKFSDEALSLLIKNQKNFKRDNEFSRTEYEKFLLNNNITAVKFESILLRQEKRKQLLDFISGGIYPPKFLVNQSYNKVNQKRSAQIIALDKIFQKKLNFTNNQIKTYFENNKIKYTEIFKSIKISEIDPKKIVDGNEFNDLFFKKIDEIDDLIIEGKNIDDITAEFNLDTPKVYSINKSGKNVNNQKIENLEDNLIQNIFNLNEDEFTFLFENKNKFFIIEVFETKNIIKDINNDEVKKTIIFDLSNNTKRKFTSEIVDKINKNSFTKLDFDKLALNEKINIQKVNFQNKNDDKMFKKDIVNQIYTYGEKRVIVVSDLSFSENYLIYIDQVKNVNIDDKSEKYNNFLNLSKSNVITKLYNTYDTFIKKRYKVDINYQAIEIVKSYFN